MRSNLTTRVERLEGSPVGLSDARMQEEADDFLKKMEALADRFTEADRHMSPEDYEMKLSTVMRAAWKVRFLGADWQTEMSEYLARRDTDPEAKLLNWRFDDYRFDGEVAPFELGQGVM